MSVREQEFTDFVHAKSPTLLRLAWMLTGDAGKAEDLLQTALAKAWPHWGRIQAGAPDRYVRRIMIRLATAWGRRRWRYEVPTDDLPEGPQQDVVATADERDRLRRALAELPARQRAVVVLRYYEDLPENEVADLLGISSGTVKSQAARGLDKLRAAMPPVGREAP